jgi:hypothetical protein
MKTIIVINDNSTEALHAAKLALRVAELGNANLWIANEVTVTEGMNIKKQVLVAEINDYPLNVDEPVNLIEYLTSLNNSHDYPKTEIKEIDISDFCVADLAQLIIKNNIWMIVKGTREFNDKNMGDLHINMQYVLNRIACPILFVPSKFRIKDFEQIVYMADLRYCRLQVVKYLIELAKPYRASVYIDHLSAKGLPNMEQNYANRFFNDEISCKVNYEKLFFNNIKERDIQKAVDVMINGMHIDLLVFVNHRFHFKEILGMYIPQILPEQITIPLLIFPY